MYSTGATFANCESDHFILEVIAIGAGSAIFARQMMTDIPGLHDEEYALADQDAERLPLEAFS